LVHVADTYMVLFTRFMPRRYLPGRGRAARSITLCCPLGQIRVRVPGGCAVASLLSIPRTSKDQKGSTLSAEVAKRSTSTEDPQMPEGQVELAEARIGHEIV
jgi:hypothetical protein